MTDDFDAMFKPRPRRTPSVFPPAGNRLADRLPEMPAEGAQRYTLQRSVRRFWEKVERREPHECWPWTGEIDGLGYGRFRGAAGGGDRIAHRTGYRLAVGPIPDGMEIDHTCRVRHCVNPAHLEPVTHAENQLRAMERRDRCKRGHVRTGRRPNGKRFCVECNRENQQQWRDRRKAEKGATLNETMLIGLRPPGGAS